MTDPAGSPAAGAVLARYLREDGAMLRRDEGGDVVSEGQAYALLLAQLAGRPELSVRIWDWTERSLLRCDGLLAWHARPDGSRLDDEAACDADVLAAFALLGHRGPDEARLHAAGVELAAAVLRAESVVLTGAHGSAPVPVAGPWALARWVEGEPATCNPSYWMPEVYRALAKRSGEPRWAAAAACCAQLIAQLAGQRRLLPSDWAELGPDATVRPVARPGLAAGQGAPGYGLDAARLPVWLAGSSEPAERALAARWWPRLRGPVRSAAQELSLGGVVRDPSPHPVAQLAAAASAQAAGDRRQAQRLTRAAGSLTAEHSRYYADAWAAIATATLAGQLTH